MDYPYFVAISGDDKDRKFPVHPGSGHQLGRHPETSYRLHDHQVSRFHCVIDNLDGTVTVRDLPGSGGTLVNGEPIDEQEIQHGDTIQVGDTVLRYLTGPMSEADLNRKLSARTEYESKLLDKLLGLTGRDVGHYRVGEVLGRGSAAVVFRATDQSRGREVALKVMHPEYTTHEENKQRFVKAMKAAMSLNHPNLVRVYGAGQTGSVLWAAMELIDGDSLGGIIERTGGRGLPDWRYAFRVTLKVSRALAHAYEQGLLHRSVSPASILIRCADQEVKLEDLLLAVPAEGGPGQPPVRPNDLIGDVNYMSPERTAGGLVPIDHRSDLFSLGATAYAVLTGRPPFRAGTAAEVVTNIRTADPAPLRQHNANIPPTFEAVVLKLLAKHPSDRPASAEELVEDLDKIAQATGVRV
jgi:serine/threonine protein kinase